MCALTSNGASRRGRVYAWCATVVGRVDPTLLSILKCPRCDAGGSFDGSRTLVCRQCGLELARMSWLQFALNPFPDLFAAPPGGVSVKVEDALLRRRLTDRRFSGDGAKGSIRQIGN